MKKKSILPVSRGEFRAIAVTTLVICLSVILPPHLLPLIQPVKAPIVQISGLNNQRTEDEGLSPLITTSAHSTAEGGAYRRSEYQESGNQNFNTQASGAQNRYGRSSHAQNQDIQKSYWQTSDARDAGSRNSGARNSGPGLSNARTSGIKKRAYKSSKIHCNTFNPNEVSGDTLVAWGMRSYIVRNMLNYRNSGGKFRKSTDLARIYGMDSMTFIQIAGCIDIPKEIIQLVYINKADTSQWMALPGIGRVLSRRIIRFRDKLGAFYSIEQVRSTYGLPVETFERIRPYLRIISQPIPIDLSTATADQLASHPNISLKQAQVMINYFDRHGRPQTMDELNNLYIADSTWLSLITPYLIITQSNSK